MPTSLIHLDWRCIGPNAFEVGLYCVFEDGESCCGAWSLPSARTEHPCLQGTFGHGWIQWSCGSETPCLYTGFHRACSLAFKAGIRIWNLMWANTGSQWRSRSRVTAWAAVVVPVVCIVRLTSGLQFSTLLFFRLFKLWWPMVTVRVTYFCCLCCRAACVIKVSLKWNIQVVL